MANKKSRELEEEELKKKHPSEPMMEPESAEATAVGMLSPGWDKKSSDWMPYLARALAGLAPIAAGALMGGKEGAAIGAGVGSDFLTKESDRDYKQQLKNSDPWLQKMLLSDQLQRGRIDQQFDHRDTLTDKTIDAADRRTDKMGEIRKGEGELNRSAAMDRTKAQVGAGMVKHRDNMGLKREQIGISKDKHGRTVKMNEDARVIRGLPGVGASPSAAERVRKLKDEADQVTNITKDLLRIASTDYKMADPKTIAAAKAEAETLSTMVRGAMRLAIIGPGAMSDQEQALLSEIAVNPMKILSLDMQNRKVLQVLQSKINSKMRYSAQNAGFKFKVTPGEYSAMDDDDKDYFIRLGGELEGAD